MKNYDVNDKCAEAFDKVKELMAQGKDGEDKEVKHWLEIAVLNAPPELQEIFNQKLKELDLIPEPFGYNDKGERMYNLSDLAKKLGMTEEEAMQHVRDMEQMGETVANSETTKIYRKQ